MNKNYHVVHYSMCQVFGEECFMSNYGYMAVSVSFVGGEMG